PHAHRLLLHPPQVAAIPTKGPHRILYVVRLGRAWPRASHAGRLRTDFRIRLEMRRPAVSGSFQPPARRGGWKPGGGEEIEDERRTGRCVAAINLDGVGEQRRAQIAMRWAWTVGRRYIVRRDVQHRRADVLFEGAEQRRVQQLGEG